MPEVTKARTGQFIRKLFEILLAQPEGMRAAEEESWKPILMYEKSNHLVTSVAPTPKAVDFRVIFMAQD